MRLFPTLTLLFLMAPQAVRAEYWSPFSQFLQRVDYTAQYQRLERNGAEIGIRVVKVYWQKAGFDASILWQVSRAPAWSLKDYDPKTDRTVTVFAFFGGRQSLWITSGENGTILYPGSTTDGTAGAEIACSPSEFHDLLLRTAALISAGKPLIGDLELPVFGKVEKLK